MTKAAIGAADPATYTLLGAGLCSQLHAATESSYHAPRHVDGRQVTLLVALALPLEISWRFRASRRDSRM